MARFLIFQIALNLICLCGNLHARDLDKLYEKATFQLGEQKFQAYIADDESKRQQGLMFIEKLPANEGMLFIFEQSQPLSFWMKNTLIPLSIGFLDKKGVLIDIQEMSIAKSLMDLNPPTYHSHGEAVFALEMTSGWFAKNKVKKNSRLKLISAAKSKLLKQMLPAK